MQFVTICDAQGLNVTHKNSYHHILLALQVNHIWIGVTDITQIVHTISQLVYTQFVFNLLEIQQQQTYNTVS